MQRDTGNKLFPLWLLGDSIPERWEKRLDSPFDPRHPIRHNIWTSVLDVIQDKVFRECRLRVNTNDIYIRNAVEDPKSSPQERSLAWSTFLEDELILLGSLIKKSQPRLILSFGAFSFGFAGRALKDSPGRFSDYWDCEILGSEFMSRITQFDPQKVNLLPLLHRSIAGGYLLSAHRNFCQLECANYFDYVGQEIAMQLIRYQKELPVWIL